MEQLQRDKAAGEAALAQLDDLNHKVETTTAAMQAAQSQFREAQTTHASALQCARSEAPRTPQASAVLWPVQRSSSLA